VSAIHITNAGCGYTVPPVITVNGGGGSGFAATTGISTNGSIQSFTVTDGGAGYYNAPTVSIGKTAGTYPLYSSSIYSFDSSSSTFDSQFPDPERPAVGLATISSSGIVTAIYVIDGGEGFDTVPVVTISGPAVNNIVSVGGTFIFNEVVTGSTSGTTARVKEWDGVNDIMEVSIVDGYFQVGEVLTGQDSGAKYVIGGTNDDDLVDPYADNDNIEIEADAIIDFSQSNPFGMP